MERNCPSCGNPISENEAMCMHCGRPVEPPPHTEPHPYRGATQRADYPAPQPQGAYRVPAPAPRRYSSGTMMWIAAALIVAAAIVVSALIITNNQGHEKATANDPYTMSAETNTDAATTADVKPAQATKEEPVNHPQPRQEAAAAASINGCWMLGGGKSSTTTIVEYEPSGDFHFYIVNNNNGTGKVRHGTYTFDGDKIRAYGGGRTATDKVVSLTDNTLVVSSGGTRSTFTRISNRQLNNIIESTYDWKDL